jgi:hypothetical protein
MVSPAANALPKKVLVFYYSTPGEREGDFFREPWGGAIRLSSARIRSKKTGRNIIAFKTIRFPPG